MEHKFNQRFKWCKKADHQKLKKCKYYVIAYAIIIHTDRLHLSAIWNKEGISLEYLDIKGQKTPTRYFTLPRDGDSTEYTLEFW